MMKRHERTFTACLVALFTTGFVLCGWLSLCSTLSADLPLPRKPSGPSADLFPVGHGAQGDPATGLQFLPLETPDRGLTYHQMRVRDAIRNSLNRNRK